MPKVSVIIPNYNHNAFLVQRIETVLYQSFQDFDIIIMDDCSTDKSREIIERYRLHPKVSSIVYNDQNSGSTFKQWEKGIALAKGKYIWIAESDDWCENTLLEELVSGFVSDEECVVSYCQSYCIIHSNMVFWISRHPYLSETIDGNTYIKTYMVNNNTIFNASMVLWKKDLYPSISKEFLNYKFCGDWLFWIELSKLGKIHVSGKVLNYFRKHDNDVSGKAAGSGLDIIETLKILNILYRDKLISTGEYNKVFKSHFKNYMKQRPAFGQKFSVEIKKLFRAAALTKSVYFKALLSATWQNLKP